jgi:16S rRNA (guanine527-N7)-methyltransferase
MAPLDAGRLAQPPEALAAAAEQLFGDRLEVAGRYAELLGTDGVVRGLIGPRETDRLWDRHLLNCAVLAELIGTKSKVIDVGSGAGLPGIVLAIARPDLTITLIEPLARRTAFLDEAVRALGLADRVEVLRGRAEEAVVGPLAAQVEPADVATARAVAPLDRLAAWCLPLLRLGGRLLALKGATAVEEVTTHRAAVDRLGGGTPEIRRCGVDLLDQPATVIEVVRERVPGGATSGRRGTGGRGSSSRGSGGRPAAGHRGR